MEVSQDCALLVIKRMYHVIFKEYSRTMESHFLATDEHVDETRA